VGAELNALRRVLRGLAAEGVLVEHPDGRFGLTALGSCLRTDVPSSLRGAIIARGDLYYGAAAGLLEAVQHGGVPFEHVHRIGFFEYLAQHPERGVEFQASMVDRSRQEAAEVVAAYDFGSFVRLVDVGGGHGVLLTEILRAVPRLQAVLLDRLPVVEWARERLEATGLAGRCEFVAGDFFESVPPGGDAYVLSRVIHDWDDEAAVHILTNCRRAMGQGGTLLLVEAVLPERARERPAAIRMDLHMLALLHGRERLVAEYERLLGAAGFRLERVVPTQSPAGVSLIEAVPTALPDR
jgi:SAM-dependent methyltransferase